MLVGAEGVVENGGVINKLGTYQIALCAKSLNKPFYVAAESYKFARLYPLNQQVGNGVSGIIVSYYRCQSQAEYLMSNSLSTQQRYDVLLLYAMV